MHKGERVERCGCDEHAIEWSRALATRCRGNEDRAVTNARPKQPERDPASKAVSHHRHIPVVEEAELGKGTSTL